jgi:2-aminoadipate transaminase
MKDWLPPIRENGSGSKVRQVAGALQDGILSGAFPLGGKLPTTRELARRYRVDRSTVMAALAELKNLGLVETTMGSGTRISAVRPTLVLAPSVEQALDLHAPEEDGEGEGSAADFTVLHPDETLFPLKKMKAVLEATLEEEGEQVMRYSDPMGYPPLRDWIAQRLGIGEDQVLIVNGAQQGLSLLCRLLLTPGSKVLVESPTYAGLLPLLKMHQAEVVPIPVGGDGIDLSALALQTGSPFKFLYLQPTLHNPTGLTLDEESRLRILKLLPRHQICVLEDTPDILLGRQKSLFELDPLKREITLGSFSKLMLPGFRVGWVAGPAHLIEACARLKALTDLHAPPLLQAALNRFIRSSDFPAYVKQFNAHAKKKEALVRRLMKAHLPRDVEAGLSPLSASLWLLLPSHLSARSTAEALLKEGLRVSPGDPFYPVPFAPPALRIVFSHAEERDLERLFVTLGGVLRRKPSTGRKTRFRIPL